ITIDDLPYDIEIGTWAKRWNLRKPTPATQHTPGTSRPPRYPDSDGWAHNPLGAEQMGSIFSAQGFEVPHAGVLLGRDSIAHGRPTTPPPTPTPPPAWPATRPKASARGAPPSAPAP